VTATEPRAARAEGASPGPRRRSHRVRWIVALVLVAVIAVAIVAATRPSVQASPFVSPLTGQRAPAISGSTLDGQRFSLADERGRWVVVNFFASWCPPCQQEEPDLVAFAFHQQRQVQGAALVSVVFHDSDGAAAQFVDVEGARWPAVADPGGIIAGDYGVTSPPTTFLIDPAGRVAAALEGPLTAAQLDQVLAQARKADG
jgi:cytochrome c biogenesis protein CcmG/thiol:disulfide interchange protein DsbE